MASNLRTLKTKVAAAKAAYLAIRSELAQARRAAADQRRWGRADGRGDGPAAPAAAPDLVVDQTVEVPTPEAPPTQWDPSIDFQEPRGFRKLTAPQKRLIRYLRRRKGWSVADLADRFQTSDQTIYSTVQMTAGRGPDGRFGALRPKGVVSEVKPRGKLSPSDRRKIRRMHAEDGYTCGELATKFGVSRQAIWYHLRS